MNNNCTNYNKSQLSIIYETSVIVQSVTPNLTTNKRKRQTGEVQSSEKIEVLLSIITKNPVSCDWCHLSFASRGINKHRFSCKSKPENSDYAKKLVNQLLRL